MKIISLFLLSFAFANNSNFEGTYEVPVDESLKTFATYPLLKLQKKEKDGGIRISYSLPLELTGLENEFRFEGNFDANGEGTFEGANGKMICVSLNQQPVCRVEYYSVKQDLSLVSELLKKYPAEEQAPRLAVATAFGGDLEGIIHFKENR
jgi:hypothetical protein